MDEEELFYENNGGVVSSSPSKRNLKYKPNQPKTQTGKDIVGNTALAAGKVTKNTGRAINAAGKTMQVAGTAAQVAGKGMQAAGKGVSAAGDGLMQAGSALSSTGLGAIAGVPLAALGGVAKGAGTASQVAGKGVDTAGKVTNEAGKKVSKAGKKVTDSGKKVENKAKKFKNNTNNTSDKLKDATQKGYKSVKNTVEEQKNNLTPGGVIKNTSKKIGDGLKKTASALKDFAKGDFEAIVEGAKNFIKLFFIKIILQIFLTIFLLVIMIYMIFSPLIEALKTFDAALTNTANTVEKIGNLFQGFGFQNTKDAFFSEMNSLNKKYDYQLDIELLMSTIFYTEMYEGYESTMFEEGEHMSGVSDESLVDASGNAIDGGDAKSYLPKFAKAVREYVLDKVEESNSTTDENGLTYTVGKIYRLRKLARNQFNTGLFGIPKREGVRKEVSLSKFLTDYGDMLGKSVLDALNALRNVALNTIKAPLEALANLILLNPSGVLDVIENIITSWDNVVNCLTDLFGTLFYGILSEVKIGWDNGFTVSYKTYSFDEENYLKYLENYYIPFMPEFRKSVYNSNGQLNTAEVKRIRQEIYETKEMYADIFGETTKVIVENYDNACSGAVNREVVSLLTLPVDINSTNCINFSNAYGFGITSSGTDHKGIDFNSITTHNDQGDNVYSVAVGGKVLESSFDNTYTGTDCKGGCLKIEYNISDGNSNYSFKAVYEGMSASSITLKKDDTVTKGTVIGTIGSPEESEYRSIASLHFAYMDSSTNTFIDPTNIVIQCSDHYEGDTAADQVVNALKSATTIHENIKKDIQLAAILGNLEQESGVNFESLQKRSDDFENPPRYSGTSGSDGHAIGIAQWDGRRNGLMDYAASKGVKWYNHDIQLNYLIGELTEGGGADGYATFQLYNSTLYNQFINATNIDDATIAYSHGFERCGTCLDNKRIEYANNWYTKIVNGEIGGTSVTYENDLRSCTNSGQTSVISGDSAITVHSSVTSSEYESRKNQIMPDGVKGSSEEQQSAYITTITVPIWDGNQETTMNLSVNKYLVDNYQAVFRELTDIKFPIIASQTGAYNYRAVASSGRLSDHGFGSAIDVNWDHNPQYGYPDNTQYGINESVIKAFAKQGFYWGGDWDVSSLDPMHFSWCGY